MFDDTAVASECVPLVIIILSFRRRMATQLLLGEWIDPGYFDIITKIVIGGKEFLILAGKFPLVDSL